MKRAIFFIMAIILCSFSSQLLALPEGAVARLGKGELSGIAFSPDGRFLAVESSIGVHLYSLPTPNEIYFLETNFINNVAAFSPDSRLLAIGNGLTVKLLDVNTKTEVASFKRHSGDVNSVVFSSDGSLLASGSGDGTILFGI